MDARSDQVLDEDNEAADAIVIFSTRVGFCQTLRLPKLSKPIQISYRYM
jgi:hypothetical protein